MLSAEASHVALGYFIRKFPYQSEKNYAELPLLDKKYKNWKLAYIGIALTLIFTLPIIYAFILQPIVTFVHKLFLEQDQQFFPPSIYTVGLVAALWAMATLVFVAENTMRLLLGNNADEFFDYYNNSQKYDNTKAGIWFGKIFFLLSLPLFPFVLNAKVIAGEKTFIIKTVTDFSERIYNYNQIKAIHYYQSFEDKTGGIQHREIMEFYFTNGDSFSPGFYFSDIEPSMNFAKYLSEKSGVKIDTLAVMRLKK